MKFLFFFFKDCELTFIKGMSHVPWVVKMFVQTSFVFSYDGHLSGLIGLQLIVILSFSEVSLLVD